jgi:hypothetical protein
MQKTYHPVGTFRHFVFFVSLLLLVFLGLGATAGEPGGATYQDWQNRTKTVVRDPSLLRYYAFQNFQDVASPIPNLAGDQSAPLNYKPRSAGGEPKQDAFQTVEGRWPEKKAVRLDQGCLSAKAPEIKDKAFTAILWIRKHGQGAHRGNNDAPNGMIAAVGNGYWNGWRLFTSTTSRQIRLEIGRPQPLHSEGINSGVTADGVWLHLAAVWDGKTMRIFINGEAAGTGVFQDAYTPADELRIGFADSGVGSIILDVDEFLFYNRALSTEEIFRDLYFHTRPSDAFLEKLGKADAAAARNDWPSAERMIAELAAAKDLHPEMRAILRLRQGDLLRKQSKDVQAAELYAVAAEDRETPVSKAKQAVERLLRMTREGRGAVLPKTILRMLLTQPNLVVADRILLRLSLAQAAADEGKFKDAHDECAALAEAQDVPPAWRSLAQLNAGRAGVLGGDYAAAKNAYENIRTIPNVPPFHIEEATERLAEVERLQAGKPARDRAAARIRPPRPPPPGKTLFVAPDGKDDDAGSKERPFATLNRARDELRRLKQNGGLPPGGAVVVIRGGEYAVDDTFVLTAADGGTPESPVIYRAADGETPRFNAGTRLTGFKPVTDEIIRNRLPEESRGKVMQTDLKAQGIADWGKFQPGGFGSGRGFKTNPLPEVFFNGEALPISRWPNDGNVCVDDVPAGNKNGVIRYKEDRASRWKDEKEVWLYGYWFWDWADSYEKAVKLDVEKKEITLAEPFHRYGYRKGQRYCVVNLLAEIDRPGEWYLDRSSGLLYLYPPADPAQASVELSLLEKPVMELRNVAHVTFERIVWETGRGDGIRITGGENCLLAGCTIRKFGGDGVVIDGGVRHGLLGCDLHTLGRGGCRIAGGNRKTLEPGGHFVENCAIYRLSRIDRTYTPCVLMNGVGNRIAHCLFYDSASSALRIEGNDHRIEYNCIHSVLRDSDDQGGADMWGDPTYRGNVFRYNYWHDMGNGLGCGQAGIRLDDAICGVWIFGNIFHRCADGGFGAVQIHGGKDNRLENNLFANCKAAVSFSAWGAERWKKYLGLQAKERIAEVKAFEPPYATRYPELTRLYEHADQNAVARNVVMNCNLFLLRDGGQNDILDNLVLSANPGFLDPEKGDFRLKPDSALNTRLDFQPIPFDEIGLYKDEYRR